MAIPHIDVFAQFVCILHLCIAASQALFVSAH
jgi:hypothetical protein